MLKIDVRPVVFWIPITVFLALVGTSLINPDGFLKVVTAINDWILQVLGSPIAIAAFLFVLTCLWAFFSPLGRVKLGGAGAKPILSRWNWFAITLSTTLAIGILLWATAEPIVHLGDPGGTSIEPGGEDAARFGLISLLMHWTFTPYAIYTVAGLALALSFHNLKLPFSLSSPITALTGRPVPKILADILDAICLMSLLFGLAASLGTGILSISGGLDRMTPLTTSPFLLAVVAFAIVAAFFLSSASGLHRGIRILSDINTRIFVVLAIFVFIAGPTADIVMFGAQAAAGYVMEFLPRSLMLGEFGNREWLNVWTVFYFANWMAWAPLASMFLARIAVGYTVREFIVMNFFAPALFSAIWMAIFGGFTLSIEMDNPGVMSAVLDKDGAEFVLYAVLEYLPFAAVLAPIFLTVSFLSYVTAADSNTDVLARLTMKGDVDAAPRAHSVGIKLIWASLVGIAAWVMISFSGIDGIRMLSNLGGLPAFFVISAFCLTLVILGTVKLGRLKETE